MSGIVVLILRILLAAALYAFLFWAVFTIYRDLRVQTALLQSRKTPPLTLAVTNTLDEQAMSFSTPEVVIGRSPACSYIIHNETVSSMHARLSYHQEQWWVEDLRSTNGTFINDERILSPTVMMNGDDLRCGQVNIRIQIEESGAAV
jgi:pSer/pThr/pTyr-binding forkhead associated (FHA) protein